MTGTAPRLQIEQVARELELASRPIAVPDAVDLLRTWKPAAFIDDLSPLDTDAVQRVRGVKHALPALPVLLYPTPAAGVGSLLLACGSLPLLRAELQDGAPHRTDRLRHALLRLFATAPEIQVLEVMRSMLPGRPMVVLRFLREALTAPTRDVGGLPSVARLAQQTGVTTRTLERTWRQYALPHPRRLRDWAVLLLVTYSAESAGAAVARTAARLGLDRQRWHRLMRRLVPTPRPTFTHSNQPFTAALLRFSLECTSRRLRGRNAWFGDSAAPLQRLPAR